jgi:hypothetical protein
VTATPDEQDAEATFEAALRVSLRGDLIAWASFAVAHMGQRPAAHHLLLLHHLEQVSRGEADRLMVLMPPGSAKSTYAYVNTDLWGAYVPTPTVAGTWYVWAEGLDGSASTFSPAGITVV